MQTALASFIKHTPAGEEADAILRTCVHCGLCLASCPTYQLLGDELDSPRGRIYLIKKVLEGTTPSARTQLHLDRCLTCRACETTCPSGVKYGHLVDIGRKIVEEQVERRWTDRLMRWALRTILPYPSRFRSLLRMAQGVRVLLPPILKRHVPPKPSSSTWPKARGHTRIMLLLEGCVQGALAPNINVAAARLLDGLGIELKRVQAVKCCGAISHHLSAPHEALSFMHSNIDAWWPWVEAGAEALVTTASGCGVHIKEYGHLLRNDPDYAVKAQRISALARDIGEVLAALDFKRLARAGAAPRKIAFHSPCTLQHGLGLKGVVEKLLSRLGFALTNVPDAHLCCGSAGTYSILQGELSYRLLKMKLMALTSEQPELIATANIGCLMHLKSQAPVPVCHWIELIESAV
jgi:Fe-S oxidoreductase